MLIEKDFNEIGQLAGFGLSFAWTQYRSWGVAGEMTQSQEESDEMQKIIEKYESNIAAAQVSLHKLNSKNFQLVSRLVLGPNVQGLTLSLTHIGAQSKFIEDLGTTLRALTFFAVNITALSVSFSEMDGELKTLLELHQHTDDLPSRVEGNAVLLCEWKVMIHI